MTAGVVLLWNRSGHTPASSGRWLRRIGRAALVLAAQLSAIAVVAVLVNDFGNFYTSWRELLGERHTIGYSTAAPGSQDQVLRNELAKARARRRGLVVPLTIPGRQSGVGSYQALVYLPAAYGMPDYEHRTFPVVELIAGSPGTPKTWTNSLAVAHVLDQEIEAGRSIPFIAVMPSQDIAGGRDTQCVNVVGGPKAETYLTVDVRTAILHAFRASPKADSWAVMGYSSGGFCATNLAMRHPDLFTSAVSIAGYSRPAHDEQTGELFGHNVALRDQNTPVWRALNLPAPDISLLLMSSAKDPATARDAAQLAAALHTPASVTRLALTHGGHNFEVWRAEEPEAFAWLSAHLTAPLAPPPLMDHTPLTIVNSSAPQSQPGRPRG